MAIRLRLDMYTLTPWNTYVCIILCMYFNCITILHQLLVMISLVESKKKKNHWWETFIKHFTKVDNSIKRILYWSWACTPNCWASRQRQRHSGVDATNRRETTGWVPSSEEFKEEKKLFSKIAYFCKRKCTVCKFSNILVSALQIYQTVPAYTQHRRF